MRPAPPMILASADGGLWHFNAMWPDALDHDKSHRFTYDGPDFDEGWAMVGSQVRGWLDDLDDEGGTP